MSDEAISASLVGKNIVILSDDYIPYEYIMKFIATLQDSKVHIVKYPEHIYRYTKINFKRAGIERQKDIYLDDILKLDKDSYILSFFFGKRTNKDKEWLLKIYKETIVRNFVNLTLSEKGFDYDENNPLFG
jgi:hypothetical protein